MEEDSPLASYEAANESCGASSNPAESEILNLDELELSDEDTWLYSSPSSKYKEDHNLSPYKWLRKDVEDPNNRGLQIARTALVTKLEEIEILNTCRRTLSGNLSNGKSTSEPIDSSDKSHSMVRDDTYDTDATDNESSLLSPTASDATDSERETLKVCSYNNATDILEQARLQEESTLLHAVPNVKHVTKKPFSFSTMHACLKQSSTRFFRQTTKCVPKAIMPPSSITGLELRKPASIEALHPCNGKQSNESPNATTTSSPNHSPFGSTVSLSYACDAYRSSLPNLNKGYYSLKSRKAKRTSESRIQCPLPVYPKSEMNGTARENPHASPLKAISHTALVSLQETQTLPSAYRRKSKSGLPLHSAHKEVIRRDSAPSPPSQRSHLKTAVFRRESMPCIARNVSRPIESPKQNSPTTGEPSVSPFHKTRTVSLNQIPNELPSRLSQSPLKRQPLSSVHNYSPEQEDYPTISRNNEFRKSSLPSKIPGSIPRSGIPVPSSQQ